MLEKPSARACASSASSSSPPVPWPRWLGTTATVNSGFAQPLRLVLQVGDLDVRDAVLARLALREPDLHLSVLERRPAPVEVDRDLLEAELLPVEAAPLVEVADVVPDRRRQESLLE